MNKLKSFFIILTLFILPLFGCNELVEDNQEVNITETPLVQNLVEDFILGLFPETENYKVINYMNKQELINSLAEITDKTLATEYVNKFYYQQDDGLYLKQEEKLVFLDPTRPYTLEKISEDKYKVFQEYIEPSGKYNLYITFYKSEKWIITDIEIIYEELETEQDRINKEIVKQSKDIQSNLILVNRENKLPEDYIPENLVEVNIPFSFTGTSEKKMLREEAAKQLEALINKANKEDILIYGVSGYRSYDTQEAIFAYNVTRYGSEEEANRISAYPGESEHQTGLTIDVSSANVNYGLIEEFEETPEGKWLQENAAEFGFIIRYPKGKEDITGYIYEPWHIRYVGIEHAKKITEMGITLEEYIEQAEKNISD